MNPNLVCKIVVETEGRQVRRGTGYPITSNRIITAAHVVDDAALSVDAASEGDLRQITVSFAIPDYTPDTPVYLEWSGTLQGIDIAVLRCQLPTAYQPTHQLMSEPPPTPTEWFAQGYTEFGKDKRPGGKDNYRGTLTVFTVNESTVALNCIDGPLTQTDWKGGSGSVAFDAKTALQALAVITRYESGKQLDQLIAIPICHLLVADSVREAFRHAIQFKLYQKRVDYCSCVIDRIGLRLAIVEKDVLKVLLQDLPKLLDLNEPISINLDLERNVLAKNIAQWMVEKAHVIDLVGALVSYGEDHDLSRLDVIAPIIQDLLPLNYAPHVIYQLREALGTHGVGLIEDEISTRTLAEIIMAGYDEQPAKFSRLTIANDPRGEVALDLPEGPEDGPDDLESEVALLQAVCNFLHDLFAAKNKTGPENNRAVTQSENRRRDEVALRREIQEYGIKLRGALKGMHRRHQKRTVYCVLSLPEDPVQRTFRKRVLAEVRQEIKTLIFVELSPPKPGQEDEFELQDYIQQIHPVHFQEAPTP